MNPRISILIPCYKGESYLRDAIGSCLNQTESDFEVIIIDDASPDRCSEIGETYAQRDARIRLIRRERNGGISRALNDGLRVARGELITRLAQDDVFDPAFLERMVSAYREAPTTGLAYCNEWYIDAVGRRFGRSHRPEPHLALEGGNSVGLGVMWRRRVFDVLGGFDTLFDTAEDYDYWLRLSKYFTLIHVGGEPLFSLRIHGEMGSQVYSAKQELLSSRLRANEIEDYWGKRRELARGFFLAGYNLRERGRFFGASTHLLRSWVLWPFDFRPIKCAVASILHKATIRSTTL